MCIRDRAGTARSDGGRRRHRRPRDARDLRTRGADRMKGLRIALSRGNIFNETAALLEGVGFDLTDLRANDRKLIFDTAEGTRFITMRPTDVPTYVEYGAADVGIVGKDVLREARKNVYEVLDLGIGRCRMVFA